MTWKKPPQPKAIFKHNVIFIFIGVGCNINAA